MSGYLSLPRVPLVTAPTPLQPAPRLSAELGAPIWLKREDLTGLGLGGNKLRGLEYLLGDALARGCDCLVTGAGPQSNWAMLAALAARRCGLDPYLVFYGHPSEPTGNLLLDGLLGADVRFTGEPNRASVDPAIEELADELRSTGRRPYTGPRGGASALGAMGYVRAGWELAGQLEEAGVAPARVWLATGSCGTQAGLVAAARWLRPRFDVVGVSVSRPVPECTERVGRLADAALELLGVAPAGGEPVTVLDGYHGAGYGRPSPAGEAAAALVLRTEGIFLDPAFGAKAMAALIDRAPAGATVFLVGGGAATRFSAATAPYATLSVARP
jgi:D-cysteine desulfhydrase